MRSLRSSWRATSCRPNARSKEKKKASNEAAEETLVHMGASAAELVAAVESFVDVDVDFYPEEQLHIWILRLECAKLNTLVA